jgi:hypothetical protein
VDVDRDAVDLAVELAAREERARVDDVAPALALGDVLEVAHEACLDQLLGLEAVVELGRGHRVAAGDAADHDRPGGAAGAGDRAVDPLVAGRVEGAGELGDGRRLAAGGPPVGDLQIHRQRRAGQCSRCRESGAQGPKLHGILPVSVSLQ